MSGEDKASKFLRILAYWFGGSTPAETVWRVLTADDRTLIGTLSHVVEDMSAESPEELVALNRMLAWLLKLRADRFDALGRVVLANDAGLAGESPKVPPLPPIGAGCDGCGTLASVALSALEAFTVSSELMTDRDELVIERAYRWPGGYGATTVIPLRAVRDIPPPRNVLAKVREMLPRPFALEAGPAVRDDLRGEPRLVSRDGDMTIVVTPRIGGDAIRVKVSYHASLSPGWGEHVVVLHEAVAEVTHRCSSPEELAAEIARAIVATIDGSVGTATALREKLRVVSEHLRLAIFRVDNPSPGVVRVVTENGDLEVDLAGDRYKVTVDADSPNALRLVATVAALSASGPVAIETEGNSVSFVFDDPRKFASALDGVATAGDATLRRVGERVFDKFGYGDVATGARAAVVAGALLSLAGFSREEIASLVGNDVADVTWFAPSLPPGVLKVLIPDGATRIHGDWVLVGESPVLYRVKDALVALGARPEEAADAEVRIRDYLRGKSASLELKEKESN